MIVVSLIAALVATAPGVGASDLNRDPGDLTELEVEARRIWANGEGASGTFDSQVGYAQKLRSTFDFLDSSRVTVLGAIASEHSNSAYERFGLALSNSELKELDRRISNQESFGEIVMAVAGEDLSEDLWEGLDPDGSFGPMAGYWVDNQDGSRLQIRIVTENSRSNEARRAGERKVAELVDQGRLSSSDEVRFHEAEFSLDEIYAVNYDFGVEHLVEGRKSPELAMSVSINPVNNSADLYAEPDALEAAQSLAKGYPDGLVRVIAVGAGELSEQQEMDPRDDWGPGNWHAGAAISIRDGNGNGQGNCTWGASARSYSLTYIVTAAHCLGSGAYDDRTSGLNFFSNSNVSNANARGVRSFTGNDAISNWNDPNFIIWYNGPRGDIAAISTDQHAVNADYSCYNQSLSGCSIHIVDRATISQTFIGKLVCASLGKTEEYQCHTVVSNDAAVVGRDYVREIDSAGDTARGDSGAGWKSGNDLHGIHLGRNTGNNNGLFTHAYYVEDDSYLARVAICGGGGDCNN